MEERFWEKVDKAGECWNWTAHKNVDGYGQMMFKTGDVRCAHRISWELHESPIPEGAEIDHVCHNRACVNPSHLRLATRAQNNQNLSGERVNGRSGYRGPSWHKRDRKWRAVVQVNKVAHYCGSFNDAAEAAAAARRKRHEVLAYNHADQ